MAPAPVKRHLAAILAADVAEYSRLMGENEETALCILSAHRGVLDSIIQFHDGRIANTAGDSVLAEFPSPVEAVRAAVEIQDALRTRNDALPEAQRMWFRIGLNLGDVMAKDEDLLGDGVNIAARLQTLAEPGGICLSASILEQIEGKLNLHFRPMGEQTLKNIARPVKAFRLDPGGSRSAAGATAASAPAGWKLLGGIAAAVAVAIFAAWWLMPRAPAPAPVAEKSQHAEPSPARHAEMMLWQTARESDNPAEVQRYLDQYPDGNFAQAARTRIASLTRAQAERAAAEAALRAAEHAAAAAHQVAAAVRSQAQAERAAAEKAQREAQAAAAAKPPEQLAALPPAARYDGDWHGEFKCGPSKLNPPFNVQRRLSVKNGVAIFERGNPNTPGWSRSVGNVGADGGVRLIGEGISGLTNENAQRFDISITGRFDKQRFSADGKFGARQCTLELTRVGSGQ
jgi:adenylate cyclase